MVPAGQTSAFFDVVTLSDQLVEGFESVTADIKQRDGRGARRLLARVRAILDVPPVEGVAAAGDERV